MAQKIKTVVFDLDGTIYQNNEFYVDYIRLLVSGTQYAGWENRLTCFCRDVLTSVRQDKPLMMNRFYREEPLPRSSPEEFFHALEKAACDFSKDACFLGDAWSLVQLLGNCLNLYTEDRRTTLFLQTREKMLESGLVCDEALKAAILALGQQCSTLLLTNAPPETAQHFLRSLGVENVFRQIRFNCNKPDGLLSAIEAACPGALLQPESILSIGDNAFNDLYPVQAIGGQTVWINSYPGIDTPTCNFYVKTTTELAQFLQELVN